MHWRFLAWGNLRDIKGHHISNASEIPDLDIPIEKGKHPRRMMVAFKIDSVKVLRFSAEDTWSVRLSSRGVLCGSEGCSAYREPD